ncbi:hypothetical protein PR202_gb22608 [Eleusine coracana subsp. coracana]|uniref:Uncharacterized protein n=1 Tax=Eleusine coracana subsp. coracana TaxID=191504 RepID=A0AAV5FG84_ELECO|nr:hypothetical protein PR202_gb22608 [Eleusine coracana subsp. coracana]
MQKLLSEQAQDQFIEIDRLKSSLKNCEKTVDECTLQHEMEKDNILLEFLNLQKELKFSFLQHTINICSFSQSEKAEAFKEIKKLESQRTFLERDLKKRDSLAVDKRHEVNSDLAGFFSQAVQMEEDYQNLEMHAADMNAEISSLQEALSAAITEKDEALSNVDLLTLELEEYVTKLSSAESERDSLSEKIAVLTENSCASESTIKRLEAALDSISREKEDLGNELTDALLDLESKKAIWTVKEKEYVEANLRLSNCHDELTKVSSK